MTKREKNILLVAIAVAIVLVISQGLPAARALHAERAATIEQIRLNIDRERRLIEDAPLWQERRAAIEDRLAELERQVFTGDGMPLVSAGIQRLVRDYANQSGLTVTSTKLAESMETEGWMLVEQELSVITGNQGNLMRFLQLLDQSRPWLGVTTFSVRRTRNQYAGTITVMGFSRIESAAAAGAVE